MSSLPKMNNSEKEEVKAACENKITALAKDLISSYNKINLADKITELKGVMEICQQFFTR